MIAFRAHNAGTGQTYFPVGQYSQVRFQNVSPDTSNAAEGYNLGGRFDTSAWTWTPVQTGESSAIIKFNGQIWVSNNGGCGSPNFVARIIKNFGANSVSCGAALGALDAFGTGFIINLAMQSYANPGDVYGVYFYSSCLPATVDGNSLHTWWSGDIV